jgi:hypothetical protein
MLGRGFEAVSGRGALVTLMELAILLPQRTKC